MDNSTSLTKLSSSDVYDRMRPLMCSICTPLGESSGFILNTDGVVLTVAHGILFENPDIQLNHISSTNPLFPKPIKSINEHNAKVLDLYAIQTSLQVSPSDVIPILPQEVPLREGMKVYFAGFPLGHEKITFHDGKISSLSNDEGVGEFTIDGTVVPGNSGGPVVTVHEHVLYLIGVITAEIADFSPEDLDSIEAINLLHTAVTEKVRKSEEVGGFKFTISRTDYSGVVDQRFVNSTYATTLAINLIQRNLSTGIGKAVDVRQFKNLTIQNPLQRAARPYSFPTKGKGLIKNTLSTEVNGVKTVLLDYIEARFGRGGAGNRGIRILMSNSSGNYNYSFSPNPHASRNYNKNQEELYYLAAKKFAHLVETTSTIPKEFTFEACNTTFKAEQFT